MRVSEEHVTHPDAAFRFLALELPALLASPPWPELHAAQLLVDRPRHGLRVLGPAHGWATDALAAMESADAPQRLSLLMLLMPWPKAQWRRSRSPASTTWMTTSRAEPAKGRTAHSPQRFTSRRLPAYGPFPGPRKLGDQT